MKKQIAVCGWVCLFGLLTWVGSGLVPDRLYAQATRVSAEPEAPGKAGSGTGVSPVEPAGGVSLPRLIKFSGTLKDRLGQPRSGIVGVTFALYQDQQGGAPLWLEVQNLELDDQGRYTVLLGATQTGGLPLELFAAGRARWLGIQVQGEEESPESRSLGTGRILLVSVPYALKAADAETLGGKPASAFVLSDEAGLPRRSPQGEVVGVSPVSLLSDPGPLFVLKAGDTMTGTLNLPALVASGSVSGAAGSFSGTVSLRALGTADATQGFNSGALEQTASAFNSDPLVNAAVPQSFRWLAEPVASNTPNARGRLSLLFGAGTAAPAATGLAIAADGKITFATGQTFPGVGGISNVTGTAPIVVTSPTADTRNVALDPITDVNVAVGAAIAPAKIAGTAATLGANNFFGNQSITGSVSATGLVSLPATTSASAGVITFGGSRFVHNFGTDNTFVGANAGNFTLTGFRNTASGMNALAFNTTGTDNTASGMNALLSNTTGFSNTASGALALLSNTTGSSNTASGANALRFNTTGFDNTASGALALLSNTTGGQNTASGANALRFNTTGFQNTASGAHALLLNTTGVNNTASGFRAGVTANSLNANTTGSNNTFIGFQAGPGTPTQLTNATALGANALVSASNALVLGDTTVSVGIGVAAPATALHVASAGDTEVSVESTAVGGRRWTIQSSATAGLAGVFQVIDRTAVASRLSIDTVGNVGIGTVTPGATLEVRVGGTTLADAWSVRSSRRLKTNIQTLAGALGKVERLRGVAFDWKADGRRDIGLIAEEVGEVVPEVVAYEDHSDNGDAKVAKSVDYARLTALLVEAVKEQQAQIRELKSEIAGLKAKLAPAHQPADNTAK